MKGKSRVKIFAITAGVLFLIVLILYGYVSFKTPESKVIQEWDVDDVSFTSVTGTCNAVVYNPNWFSLNCKELECVLFFKDKEIGKAVLSKPTDLMKNAETILPLTFDLSFQNLAFSDLNEMMKDSVSFQSEVKGKATWLNIPFSQKGEVKLSVKDWVNNKLPDFNPLNWLNK
jgi:LEA14-like dessication related protein